MRIGSIAILAIVFSMTLRSAVCAQDSAPNIVLFLVDDMGWNDTSVEFHSERTVWNDLYDTPNMQRLADRGMRFTNAYASSPVCSPTRVSLMTGCNPARSGVTSWVGHRSPSQDNRYLRAPTDWATTGVQPGDGNVMLPSLLAAVGYRTAHVGKAHFGESETAGANPTNLGFDINVGGSHIGGPYSYFSPWMNRPNIYPNLQQQEDGTYITDALTAEANKIIDQAVSDNVPFFLNMAHYAVHAPISGQGDPRFLQGYENAGRPDPEDDYAAMIASMDRSLGEILDKLEQKGIADNTLVLFMSDNGGLSNHSRHSGGRQTVQTLGGRDVSVDFQRDGHNRPLRSGKGSGYEGGTRVPMIVAWAGQEGGQPAVQSSLAISPGSVSNTPVSSDDFFPTLLKVAGIAVPDNYRIDGQDISPILSNRGEFDVERPLYFHYPHQWYRDIGVGEGIEPFSAIRQGDFKLLYFYGDGKMDGNSSDPRFELYDLSTDIDESENLARSEAEKLYELGMELRRYLIEVDAPLPVVIETDEDAELPAPPQP